MRSPFSKDRTWVSTDVGRLLFFAFNHGVGINLLSTTAFRKLGRFPFPRFDSTSS